MNIRVKTFYRKHGILPFFRKINICHPWLKIAIIVTVFLAFFADFYQITCRNITEVSSITLYAPMQKHIKATNRSIFGKKLIALTFDDGPSTITTPKLLDILKEKDVVATFFVLGQNVEKAPEIAKRAYNEGHEIASHTMCHQNFNKLEASQIEAEFENAQKTISASLDGAKINLARAPYGNTSAKTLDNTTTPLINWSVDTLDWQSKDPSAIIETTLSQAYDGGIILMHDIYQTSIDAVPELIDRLRQEGYEFVTVSELAKIRQTSLSVGQVYYNFKP